MAKTSFYSGSGTDSTEAPAGTPVPPNHVTALDAIKTEAEAAQTAAETAETNAAASATSAASSASTATTQASTATTQATNAASSATTATTQANTATTQATNAAASASTASTHASTATTKATEAATSATSSETAKTASETAKTAAETAETNAASSASAAATSAASINSYTGGTGITVSGTTITNDSPDQTVALTAGSNVSVSGTYPNFTISSTDTNTTYSVGDNGLTEKNFTTTLKNKLDAIEASADVTDTANVTAAGALMDSEVTNLAQVKAFDSSDYATAAQGATADAAMPLSGGTFTGDVTLLNSGDGGAASPYLKLKRDSASPAAWDYLGIIRFLGEDGGSNETPYSTILGRIVDPTGGSEDGRIEIHQMKGGTETLTYVFDHDVFQLQNEQPIKWKEHHGTAYDVFLEPTTPTATRTITLPDATGTVLLSDGDGSNLTNVQAASVNVTESVNDNVTYNVLLSDTSGTGTVQMTPQQDDNGLTFNPAANELFSAAATHQYVYVQDYIYHSGDTDTNIRFETNSIKLAAGGTTPLKVTTRKTTFDGAIEEETRTSGGSGSVTLNGDYGTIWEITSQGTWTFTDGLTDGESVTVLIDQSSGGTVTWPTVTWLNSSSAPTLSSNINTFVFFKVGTTLYGSLVGDQT